MLIKSIDGIIKIFKVIKHIKISPKQKTIMTSILLMIVVYKKILQDPTKNLIKLSIKNAFYFLMKILNILDIFNDFGFWPVSFSKPT